MIIYLQLFWEFFKTGLFAIGGGMATIPFLREMGERMGWFDAAALADMLAVSESTPGPMGINMATYVGFTVGSSLGSPGWGVLGSLIATVGEVTPSIIVILIIAAFLKAFRSNKYVERAFYGMRPASTALIASAGIGVMLLCLVNTGAYEASGSLGDLFNWKGLLLFAVIWALTNPVKLTKKWHPLAFIGFSALVGIVFGF